MRGVQEITIIKHGESCQDNGLKRRGYAWFIEEIRKNQKDHDIGNSVRLAIESMPANYVIKGFLIRHIKEVEGMLDTEYNEAEVKELFKEEGRVEGREETIISQICKKLLKGKDAQTIADEIEEPVEEVSKICNIASRYLPNYDVYKIMEELR